MTESKCQLCGKEREKIFTIESQDKQKRIKTCPSCTKELGEKGWRIVG